MGKGFYDPPPSPWPRPKGILVCRPGILPRQSYPPQKGLFKLSPMDPVTQYLNMLAEDEMWEEWDYCWSRLEYLPRWDIQGIWDCPPGWITPHAYLAWSAWHLCTAHQWISRLLRASQRSHSTEDLLSSARVLNPIYMFLDQGQLEFVRKRLFKVLHMVRASPEMLLPTNEKVVYPPDGLFNYLGYLRADPHLDLFEWHESRAQNKALEVHNYAQEHLRNSAILLKRHLGESAWSE